MDSLALASRVAVLAQLGRKESTYKLALLMAMLDTCLEAGQQPRGELQVGVADLTHRMVGYYWPQVRVFHDHGRLRQTRAGTSIPDRIAVAQRELVDAGIRTPDAAREINHPVYVRLVHSLELTVAQQPITHLQTVPHASRASVPDDFLFDASEFHKRMTRADLERADPLVLLSTPLEN